MHWVGKPKTSNIRKIDCCFVRIEPADILSQLLAEKQLSRSLTKIRNSRILYRLNWIPLAASCSCTENDRWSTVPAILWNKCVDPKFWTVYSCLTEGLFIHSTFWEREKMLSRSEYSRKLYSNLWFIYNIISMKPTAWRLKHIYLLKKFFLCLLF